MTSSKKAKANKTFNAAALSYDGQGAPIVQSAAAPLGGERRMETLIRRTALRYGIPVKENAALAEKLAAIENESEIPQELYTDVARVFCEVEKAATPRRRR